jgi:hypothetical protein
MSVQFSSPRCTRPCDRDVEMLDSGHCQRDPTNVGPKAQIFDAKAQRRKGDSKKHCQQAACGTATTMTKRILLLSRFALLCVFAPLRRRF